MKCAANRTIDLYKAELPPERPVPPPVIEDPDWGVRLARRYPRLLGWLEHTKTV